MSTATQPPATHGRGDNSPGRAGVTSPSAPLLLRRLHFYVGVFVAPFLVVAALSGLAYVVTPQLDQYAYGGQLRVAEVGEQQVPLATQVSAAEQVVPEGTLLEVIVPEQGDATTQVVFDVPELTDLQRTVYVDPYQGEVRGVLDTSFGKTPLMMWFRDWHGNLHLGEPGRLYSELAASWLAVLALSGVVLWWRHQRPGQRLRRMLGAGGGPGQGVRRTRGRHATLGTWLVVALLALSATGLTWSTYAGARFDQVQDSFNSQKVSPSVDLTGAGGASGGGHHGGGSGGTHSFSNPATFDAVLAVARDHGLDGPLDITPAGGAGEAWTASQADSAWPVRLDAIAVDPHTRTVTDEVRWADQPLLAKLSSHGIQLHMGLLFGPLNQLLMAGVAIGLLVMIVLGYRMWWQRRPTRADRRRPLGTPPARGGWRQVPLPLLGLLLLAAVGLGWAMPLLGLSLLGFLALDLAIGLVRRARRTPVPR